MSVIGAGAPPGDRTAVAKPGPPLIAELVGPAGAGKTAMLRRLGQRHTGIRAGLSIDRTRFLPALTWYALALVPTGLEVLQDDWRSTWPVMLHLLRLRTLPAVVTQEASTGPAAIVLDEGPLFSLARLSVFHRARENRARLGREWDDQLGRWSNLLDVVVWLDAPDAVLAQRIRKRLKPHRVKDDSDQAIYEFLAQYRRAYSDIRARLVSTGHTRIIDVDTSVMPAEQSVPMVLAALTSGRR
jgi:hypothetical protein